MKYLDIRAILFLLVLALVLSMSMLNLYGSSLDQNGILGPYFQQQCIWLGIGLLLMLVLIRYDYRLVLQHALVLFALSIAMLISL